MHLKTKNTIEDGANPKHRSKIKTNEQFIFKNFLAAEAIDELNKTKKIEQEINRDDLTHITGNKKKSSKRYYLKSLKK